MMQHGVGCWFLVFTAGLYFIMSALFKRTFVVWFWLLLKSSLFEEMLEIRWPMAAGRCFITVGEKHLLGWPLN